MKAALIQSYGSPDVLKIQSELKIPEPLEDEVLIRVKAASVNPIDWKIRRGDFKFISGFSFPKILGCDFAGTIAGIGNLVEQFRVGDAVFGMLPYVGHGSYAQFTVAKQKNLVHKPKNLSFEESASIPLAGLTAFQALSLGGISKEKRVLILGGSGGVGSLAIQIAKAYECSVTASGGPQSQMFLREMGADETLDYSTQSLQELKGFFDIIVDASGRQTFPKCQSLLTKDGIYVTTLWDWHNLPSYVMSLFQSQKSKVFLAKSNTSDLLILKKFLEKNKIRPVVDRVYPLEQIREAHIFAEAEHIRGKIVISIPN